MSYTVCPSDPVCDRADILDLWRENLPDATEDRYAWLYQTGPTRAWLVKSQQGAVVGSAGLTRRTMRVFGNLVTAGQAIDLNVAKDHRTVGPALGLQRAVTGTVRGRELGLIYGFPNKQSEPIQRRVGYRVLGQMATWTRPLRVGPTMKARLRNPLVRKVLPPVVNPLLKLNAPEVFCRLPRHVRAEVIDRFDGRFDALWERAAGQFDVVGLRTADYLNWRFRRCPDVQYRVLCLTGAGDELLAYLVYLCRKGTAHIGDFFFADERSFGWLLAELLRRMRREKIETASTVYLGSSIVTAKLKKSGFWKRPNDWNTLVYVDKQSQVADFDRLFDPQRWYLTRADIDTDD